MTSKFRGATECFVYMTLPGQTEAVPAGRFALDMNRQGVVTGRVRWILAISVALATAALAIIGLWS